MNKYIGMAFDRINVVWDRVNLRAVLRAEIKHWVHKL